MHHSHSPRKLRFPLVPHRAAAKLAPVKPQQHQQSHNIRAIAFHPEGGLSPMEESNFRDIDAFAQKRDDCVISLTVDWPSQRQIDSLAEM